MPVILRSLSWLTSRNEFGLTSSLNNGRARDSGRRDFPTRQPDQAHSYGDLFRKMAPIIYEVKGAFISGGPTGQFDRHQWGVAAMPLRSLYFTNSQAPSVFLSFQHHRQVANEIRWQINLRFIHSITR